MEAMQLFLTTAAGGNILFANPKYDISDQVLEKLGYKN